MLSVGAKAKGRKLRLFTIFAPSDLNLLLLPATSKIDGGRALLLQESVFEESCDCSALDGTIGLEIIGGLTDALKDGGRPIGLTGVGSWVVASSCSACWEGDLAASARSRE
jgi:hypothetical protein